MFWMKKKKAVAKKQRKPRGFFSTEISLLGAKTDRQIKAEMQKQLRKSIQRTVADAIPVDAMGKQVALAGTGMDATIEEIKALNAGVLECLTPTQWAWFAGQGFIGYQACAIIAQNWLVDKICAQPARDAIRNGWDVTVNDGTVVKPEALDMLRDLTKAFNIEGNLIEWIHMGRVFGIRIAMPIIESEDKDFYTKPFNIDGVTDGSYKGWTQIDPYWITPELDINSASNPMDPNFYEPTWWRVNGKRYHRTHLLIFRNGRVADILKPTYLYGAPSVPQQIAERVYSAERCANEVPSLLLTKRMTVLNVDITDAVANPVEFQKRMDAWVELQNNYAVKVAGELEKVTQTDTSLSDLDDVVMSQFQLVAAAGRVPATKVLGTTPKGFNATGEYDESSYHEELKSLNRNDATPFVERHNLLAVKSYVAPKMKMEPFRTTVVFKAVNVPTDKEQAEINKIKAETDTAYINAGAIDGFDSRSRLAADPDSGYTGIPEIVEDGPGDREAQQEAEGALEQPVNSKPGRVNEGDKE